MRVAARRCAWSAALRVVGGSRWWQRWCCAEAGYWWRIIPRVSVVQACADAQAAIARARSLFGSAGAIEVPNSAAEITAAAQTATAGRDRTVEMAGGAGMPAYREMVDRSVPPLTTAATSDAGLTTQLTTAAAVSRAGAAQLDSIAAQTRTISAAAPTARSAAAQRAIVTALRAQMMQASQVVQTTQQQAGAAATQIRSLQYPKDAPASGFKRDRDDGDPHNPYKPWDPKYSEVQGKLLDLYDLEMKISEHTAKLPYLDLKDPIAVAEYDERSDELNEELFKMQAELGQLGVEVIIQPAEKATGG
jgi:hypothetical protein